MSARAVRSAGVRRASARWPSSITGTSPCWRERPLTENFRGDSERQELAGLVYRTGPTEAVISSLRCSAVVAWTVVRPGYLRYFGVYSFITPDSR